MLRVAGKAARQLSAVGGEPGLGQMCTGNVFHKKKKKKKSTEELCCVRGNYSLPQRIVQLSLGSNKSLIEHSLGVYQHYLKATN